MGAVRGTPQPRCVLVVVVFAIRVLTPGVHNTIVTLFDPTVLAHLQSSVKEFVVCEYVVYAPVTCPGACATLLQAQLNMQQGSSVAQIVSYGTF